MATETTLNPNKRRIIFLILIGVVAIAAGFLIWWQFFRTTEEPPTNINTNTAQNTNVATVNVATNTAVNSATNEASVQLDLLRLSNFFAERYGSYSSEAQFQNSIDLKPYMTPAMQKSVDAYIASQKNLQTNTFTSVVSKVITTTVVSQTADSATVEMTMLRTERTAADAEEQQYYQSITLELAKGGEEWLVDTATWGARQ